ncbi:hypothetical protein AVEN_182985-1 [Araneus ventricosus]|uniref:NSFL1 cofactor p47 n=1 Tax=Araneus ventricosus TaxID=182803 RepID=A0A4Y2WCA8_ARAVE|nr:hypothetical protein AVEN_182985-1 [Araneus ventricosus]
MADSEQSQLIDEFCKVTGTDASRARMYLEANGWDSDQRARESLDERNAENVADSLRRARARSDQQMSNRVNSQAETNVSEDDRGMMTEICNFCQALYWRNEL